ncbi:MAG TPA: hypothetical protein VFU05_00435 [Cyclobacteriaceae bacterium]|nr:hypothetical protein [Cyclobacteriaceae bacterium]
MLLNRFLSPLRNVNFKYIISEVLLIFIGISLSLYFDQWRANRASDKKEKELLAQLIPAIQRDTAHLNVLINVNNNIANKMTYLIDSGRFEDKPSKKTILYLAHINYFYPCKPDFSAFENIKHEGISLISNQDLRISMIKYYELMTQQKEWTENIINGHFDLITQHVIDDFVDYQFASEAVPEDFSKLKADKKFWKLIKRTKMFCELTASQMSIKKKVGAQFIDEIQKEITL